MSEYKQSELYWHEALDRSSLAVDFFSDNVANHEAVSHDEELKAAAEKITELMADFYQAVGRKAFAFKEDKS
ncbi:MAG TPA: hypothetical protein VMW50_03485 [Dehalococcoidia bacterium]|nr:hypothetical protein [Dehalococcoidia bacterium]